MTQHFKYFSVFTYVNSYQNMNGKVNIFFLKENSACRPICIKALIEYLI